MLLQLVEGPRPILPEKSRKGPVRQQLTASLAGRAVIRLVVRVLDPLDRGSAPRAGLAVAAVNRDPRVERRELRREIRACLFDEEVGPPAERRAGALVQPLDLGVVGPGREAGRGELRLVEDLVRVRVPDAAQDPRVREGPLRSEERRVGKECRARWRPVYINNRAGASSKLFITQSAIMPE